MSAPPEDASTAGPREIALAVIRQEHSVLDAVVKALAALIEDVDLRDAEPDFTLLSAALFYLADFPARFHHPKEDYYLFKALRLRAPGTSPILDDLQAEHARDAEMLADMNRALVHFQGGGQDGVKSLRAAIDAYAAMLAEHMRKEHELQNVAHDCLLTEDWLEIAAAFEANDDPLIGSAPREEFRKLYYRIVNGLPTKLRIPALREKRWR